jgi:hypothetical protein
VKDRRINCALPWRSGIARGNLGLFLGLLLRAKGSVRLSEPPI